MAASPAAGDGLAVHGSLPDDINGVYVRNGPGAGPAGGGMVHGVWLTGGSADYRARPVPGGPGTAGHAVIRHGGHYLALAQAGAPGAGLVPAELTADLDLAGPFDFGGGLPGGIAPHPRIDPRSGELVAFRAGPPPPCLSWAAIGPDGSVTVPPAEVAELGYPYLIHDFALTEHYVVFVLGPALADGSWQPVLGSRVALVPRSGTVPVSWHELGPLWAWHLGNAYEDDRGRVVVDFPRWSRPAGAPGPGPLTGGMTRVTVDPASGPAALTAVDDLPAEFPRIDDRLTGRRHRYLTVVAASGRPGLPPGRSDRLVRYDMVTGRRDMWDTGADDGAGVAVLGEVVFAPRSGLAAEGPEELDGYYLALAGDLAGRRSWLAVWDAGDFPGPPQARVALPAPVPDGQHGGWFPLHRP